MIVGDAGPLIAFARIGQLDLLRQVVEDIILPDAVYEEIATKGRSRPGAQQLAESGWVRRREINAPDLLDSLPAHLHPGEREAIALALELNAQLLIDERRGRAVAKALGIDVVGSLTVLAEAKKRGFIRLAGPLVTALVDAGHWLEASLVRTFLEEVGEGEGA
jgi:uncharacterized protein